MEKISRVRQKTKWGINISMIKYKVYAMIYTVRGRSERERERGTGEREIDR